MSNKVNNNFKFLVVDDSSLHRVSVIQMLRILGFNNVEQAVDGVDAYQKMRTDHFDFLITDWNMPKLNGLELIDVMQNDKNMKHIHVIMMTNRGDKDDIREAVRSNVKHYILKPVTPEALESKIKACTGYY